MFNVKKNVYRTVLSLAPHLPLDLFDEECPYTDLDHTRYDLKLPVHYATNTRVFYNPRGSFLSRGISCTTNKTHTKIN